MRVKQPQQFLHIIYIMKLEEFLREKLNNLKNYLIQDCKIDLTNNQYLDLFIGNPLLMLGPIKDHLVPNKDNLDICVDKFKEMHNLQENEFTQEQINKVKRYLELFIKVVTENEKI